MVDDWDTFEELMDEPDAWVVATPNGTMVRGPFGTEEAAEAAREAMGMDMLGVVPVYL